MSLHMVQMTRALNKGEVNGIKLRNAPLSVVRERIIICSPQMSRTSTNRIQSSRNERWTDKALACNGYQLNVIPIHQV